MTNKSNENQVAQFLCQPQGGRNYLLNALNTNSEQIFIEALHNIIDAMSQDILPLDSSSRDRSKGMTTLHIL